MQPHRGRSPSKDVSETADTIEDEAELTPAQKWAKIQGDYADPNVPEKVARRKAIDQIRTEFELLFEQDSGTLYRYDNETGTYRDDAEWRIRKRFARTLEEQFTTGEQTQIFHQLESRDPIPADEFRGPEELLCVRNGVLDISDPQKPVLQNHSPEYRFRRQFSVQYDPTADCPQFKQFLDEVVYDDDRDKLQEFVGYCLHYWGTPFNRALMLTGPTQSGKSTFLQVVTALLGVENVASESLQRLASQRFAQHQLVGKYANIRADLDSSAVQNIGLFKELAAGDTITVEQKYEDPFRFEVTQKQLYAANQVPELAEEDDAFHERWIHVQFPETIPRDERDSNLVDKLTTEGELSGVLNWALEGYGRLMRQKGFTDERSLDDKQELWKSKGDSIDQFVNAVLDTNTSAATPESDVYDAYREFCDDIGRNPEAKQTLTKRLKQDHNVGQARPVLHGEQVRCYTGVGFTDEGQHSDSHTETETESIL